MRAVTLVSRMPGYRRPVVSSVVQVASIGAATEVGVQRRLNKYRSSSLTIDIGDDVVFVETCQPVARRRRLSNHAEVDDIEHCVTEQQSSMLAMTLSNIGRSNRSTVGQHHAAIGRR